MPQRNPESWPALASLIEEPNACAGLSREAFDDLLKGLAENGVQALFCWKWGRSDGLASWPEDQRRVLDQLMLRYKAAWVARCTEFERVLGLLRREGLTPVLLKGIHLALAYYQEPFLRPMSDVDWGFQELPRAERAHGILRRNGYELSDPGLSGNPWSYSPHLPTLTNPRTGFRTDIHGSLVYAPRDRRYDRVRVLLESPEEIRVGEQGVLVLRPEANVVYLFAHALESHGSHPPKLVTLYDVTNVLKVEGERFDWERLASLAIRAGFASTTARGLTLLQANMPQRNLGGVLERLLEAARKENSCLSSDRMSPGSLMTQKTLRKITYARGILGPPRLLWYFLFPPTRFMRAVHSELAGWPVAFLYPYRWWTQARKVAHYVLERLRRSRHDYRSNNGSTNPA